MNQATIRISTLTLLALVISSSPLLGQTVDQVRTVALNASGNAPGTNPGLPFGTFGIPVINDFGQTAFFTELSGPPISGVAGRGEALFSEGTPTGLSQVFREDEFVPNSGGMQRLVIRGKR